ncbi:hypothetical protein OB236_18895 [Paenibacillus sp. WQ 127069]|uniref:Uncharacterized protein n=1 Tax=Paenibacillus baimaensis TaxID=2982185 RepID=A0ABT2UHQ4_9BACL|nr:hypothetical protein [Paenibacillus sp. WQ 127069]MCU6794176.1 hypothetical protein [Paenibacillus sp. WQ 127069]
MSDKKAKMKISELKSKLNQLSKQEMMKLLVESYKRSEEVQEYLGSKLKEGPVILTIFPNEDHKESTSVVQLNVWKEWMEIPVNIREAIVENVWCGKCAKAVLIRDYTIYSERSGLVLKGACAECGGQVARVVD